VSGRWTERSVSAETPPEGEVVAPARLRWPGMERGRPPGPRLTVLAGGVGAARFLRGLVAARPDAEITVVGNTADDIEVWGLHISPDLDTVMYTLAGRADLERGWGLAGETWSALCAMEQLGGPGWFQLGDQDLATHLWRTERLRRGVPLSRVTAELAERLRLPVRLLPMTDQRVTTRIRTGDHRDLHIQEYFVRERCEPEIAQVHYAGVERARPGPGVLHAIEGADAVILAPSNPVMSLGPILALPGVRPAVRSAARAVAVTPIVAGAAIKGPAVAMLRAVGWEPTAEGVAAGYQDCATQFVLDERDRRLAPAITALGVQPWLTDTLMVDLPAARRLAETVLEAAGV